MGLLRILESAALKIVPTKKRSSKLGAVGFVGTNQNFKGLLCIL